MNKKNIQKDTTLEFLNKVTPRIGPANAVNLIKDAHIEAFRELFIELGLSKERVQEAVDKSMETISNRILSQTPVISPIQQTNRPQ